MHWASGMFGYFPSYAIGSAYAAQIYAAMERDTDIPGMIRSGNLRPIVEWLTARIYRHGAAFTPAEVLRSACGADFDPTFYTDYLKRKYTALYGL